MLQRARSFAPVVALVLVAVPILFGLIDGATGVLVGLAFSGLVVVVAAALYVLVEVVNRRFDQLEKKLARQQRQPKPQNAKPARPAKGGATSRTLRHTARWSSVRKASTFSAAARGCAWSP